MMAFQKLFVSLLLVAWAQALPTIIHRRQVREAYDYVIVGGGTSGLVVAARLTEDPNTTVLVIEAGKVYDGETELNSLLIPRNAAGIASSVPEAFWDIYATPIPGLNNRNFFVRQAKVVGGGSAVNGMLFDRASKPDLDDWAKYIGDESWNFDNMLQWYRKFEKFTPPTAEQIRQFSITWDPEAHGTDGPVSAAFPPVIDPAWKVFHDAEVAAGIPEPLDGANGDKVGTFWVPNSVKPVEWIRSYAKNSYHDNIKTRPNYHLLTETTVTKVNFDSKKNAIGVSYAKNANVAASSVKAKKEVIVSAGGVMSAKVLQLSGIGDKRLLQSLNVPVVEDLPGVGLNFQDHGSARMTFRLEFGVPPIDQTNAELLYRTNRTGPWTVSVGNHLSYYSFPMLSPDKYLTQIAAARAADDTPYFPSDIHPDFLAGYKVQKKILLDSFSTNSSGVTENVRTLLSVQRPFSRGIVRITSANPFERPTVEWRTLSHPFDVTVLTEAARQMRRTFAHEAFRPYNQGEVQPGVNVQTDAQLETYFRANAQPTYYHCSSSCTMGKREHGGVVDSKLRVYGVKRLRVIDSSIIPLTPGSHLSNNVYAVAEKGAALVKEGI